jgi:hypothetical protein
MKLVRWEFQGLHVPMMEDEKGDLFCTTKQLADALNTDERTIRRVQARHQDEFTPIGGQTDPLRAFLFENKVEFGMQRIRKELGSVHQTKR